MSFTLWDPLSSVGGAWDLGSEHGPQLPWLLTAGPWQVTPAAVLCFPPPDLGSVFPSRGGAAQIGRDGFPGR